MTVHKDLNDGSEFKMLVECNHCYLHVVVALL